MCLNDRLIDCCGFGGNQTFFCGFLWFFVVFSSFSTDFQSFFLSDPMSEAKLCAATDPKFIWKSPDGIFCFFPGKSSTDSFLKGEQNTLLD